MLQILLRRQQVVLLAEFGVFGAVHATFGEILVDCRFRIRVKVATQNERQIGPKRTRYLLAQNPRLPQLDISEARVPKHVRGGNAHLLHHTTALRRVDRLVATATATATAAAIAATTYIARQVGHIDRLLLLDVVLIVGTDTVFAMRRRIAIVGAAADSGTRALAISGTTLNLFKRDNECNVAAQQSFEHFVVEVVINGPCARWMIRRILGRFAAQQIEIDFRSVIEIDMVA
mmetsp:Transcript_12552/g.18984  ORF Transcript_12552/g.18984 Transcript_12552/m.18984 type:complete len:232 (-) Transcript_12552:1519-2214(-)